jgi:N-acetylmuramic acid 6-phosphate (MurNAc-6-P) etherase
MVVSMLSSGQAALNTSVIGRFDDQGVCTEAIKNVHIEQKLVLPGDAPVASVQYQFMCINRAKD